MALVTADVPTAFYGAISKGALRLGLQGVCHGVRNLRIFEHTREL